MKLNPFLRLPAVWRLCGAVCTGLCALLASPMAAATAANWSITDLGAGFFPGDINDHGVIVPNRLTIDGSDYYGLRLNNLGQIVLNKDNRAYLLDNGVLTDLWKDGLQQGNAINDAGQVAGYGCSDPFNNKCGMAVWRNGVMNIVLDQFGYGYHVAWDINGSAHLAGFIEFDKGSGNSTVDILVTHSTVVPMVLDGNTSYARALNDLGHVVGQASTKWTLLITPFFTARA